MNFTDAELLMYLDGTLDEERAKALDSAVMHDEKLAKNMAALDASQLPYKAAYAQQVTPPVPEALRAQITELAANAIMSPQDSSTDKFVKNATHRQSTSPGGWMTWSQGLATAACVNLCVLFGYWIGSAAPSSTQSINASQTPVDPHLNWVERVANYQSLYVFNTVGAVVPNRSRAVEMLSEIELRTGLQTELPDLSEADYEFVRAQELGYQGEPLVQLVYSKPGSLPLALCFMPSNNSSESNLVLANYHDQVK